MKKKLLLVQPIMDPPGGGNAVSAWMLEGLKKDFAITVLTWKPFDLAAVNRFYGTSLVEADFTVKYAPRLVRLLSRLDPDPSSIQPANYLLRICKKIRAEFDVFISANNEVDFGVPGIQYIHYPYLAPHYSRYLQSCPDSAWRRARALLQKEIAPWMVISDYSYERMKDNLSLVNSEWTGRRMKDLYGVDAVTLYPPVPGEFADVPWEDRENAFVAIGRIHPGKRFGWIIETLARVRQRTPELKLHLIGTRGTKMEEAFCYRRLLPLLEANASWVFLHENLSRTELVNLVAHQRYGIHAQVDEHFGIAPAEMVRAGCVTFVHDSGGQVEIVGDQPALVFDSADQLVDRINSILTDSSRQLELRRHLAERAQCFSSERFVAELRHMIGEWSDGRGRPASRSATPAAETAAGTHR